ncbi:hypothetical protein [Micromonospora sp. S-DT3-3-22]|nr:hypothetical protein [Micromonospora sp. S-DT3-3-22]
MFLPRRVAAGAHQVDGVLQTAVDDVQPHPTVMQMAVVIKSMITV